MITMKWSSRQLIPAREGFSMVEVMMVVMLVGILATISAPPMFKYLEANHMQTRSDRMVADLQFARAIAVSTGQAHRFACSSSTYTLTNLVTDNVLRDVTFDHGAQLDAIQFADFFPWGMASTTTFNLSMNDMQREIRLLPTGMVEVEIQ